MKFPDIDIELIKRLYEKTLRLAEKELSSLSVIDTIVAASVVFVLLLVICSILSGIFKSHLPWNSRIGYALAGAYGIFMIELAIFARERDSRDGIFANSMFESGLTEAEKILIFLNVLFFIPFGIALAEGLYHQFKFIKSMIITVTASLIFTIGIETVQRYTGRGYFEIADMEANTLGGTIGSIIGVAIGAAFYSKFRKKTGRKKKKRIKNKD